MNQAIARMWLVARGTGAVGAGVWLGHLGGLSWGVAGALLSLAIPAVFLLIGFLALRRINREPAPPTWPELVSAWWRECWALERVFSWAQPWRAAAQLDHLPSSAGAAVLFLHGFACNRGLWNEWMARLRLQPVAFMALNLEPVHGSIDAYAESIDVAVRRLRSETGRMPVIVAHSMGGLAARAWWRAYASSHDEPPPRIITLGSPHCGTLTAVLSPARNARQMRFRSAWLQELATGSNADPRIDCVYSNCDQVVCPTLTAVLPGSRAIHFPGVGHLALVFDPRSFALLQALLDELSSVSTPRRI
jgi:hypothetical protein